jgi:competence protein ComEC
MRVAPTAPSPTAVTARPLFGGYALVAACAAWLAGIALHKAGPFATIGTLAWAVLALGCGAYAAALFFAARFAGTKARGQRIQHALELLVTLAIVVFWLALGAARATWGDPASDPRSVARLPQGKTLELQGVVAAEPTLENGGRLLTLDVSQASLNSGSTWGSAVGRVEAFVAGPDDWFAPAYGDTLQLTGKLQPVTKGAPAGVLARLSSARAQIEARGGGNPLLAWLFALRVRLAEGIQRALPEPEASLLIGILLGLKTPTLRARLALFTTTGTIHLVVPAGLKVSLLADIARRAALPLGRWMGTGASLVAVAGYAALGGGGAAAVRAAIMGALLALAPALGRRYDVYSALALAALVMTAVEPLLIYDVGFQLTVLATLGIPLLTPTFESWLLRPFAGTVSAAWLTPVAELLAVTMAAQVATLPVLAITFGLISIVAPLANLLAVPLLAPLLLFGVALAVATLAAPGLAVLVGFAAWPMLWLTDQAIAFSANLPSASIPVAGTPVWLAWVYYAVLVGALAGAAWLVRLRARATGAISPSPQQPATPPHQALPRGRALFRGALVVICLITLLSAWGAAGPALAAGTARLDFLDVGPGGAATLLRLADGTTALIDGGPSGPTLEEALSARLPFWQRTLDLAVLTNPAAAAETGLQDATTHYTIRRAADAGMLHPTTVYLAWLDALSQAGVPRTQVRQDDVISLGPSATLRALAPPQDLYPDSGGATVASNDLILRLDTPGLHALLLGNADAYALDALAFAGEPLDADVVELALSPGAALDLVGPLGDVLRAAHPRLVVVAQGPTPPRTGTKSAPAAVPQTIWPPDAEAAQALGTMIVRVSGSGTVSLAQRANGGWDLEGA